MAEHFHLITPVGRPENMQRVSDSVNLAFEDPDADYTWWWVQYFDEELGDTCNTIKDANPRIKYIQGDRLEGWHDIMVLFNIALSAVFADEQGGWIWQVQDDNIVPPWAIDKWCDALKEYPDKNVLVCCHDRGDFSTRHGTSPLVAEPSKMHVGGVSLEQYLIRKESHEPYLYANSACGDGIIMQQMHEANPAQFAFLTNFYIPFNALEPGRWTPAHLSWFTEWTDVNPRRVNK